MEKLSLSALVANHAGVLLRVVGLFSRRGYNIQSLTVSETEDPRFSRMTIVSEAAPVTISAKWKNNCLSWRTSSR